MNMIFDEKLKNFLTEEALDFIMSYVNKTRKIPEKRSPFTDSYIVECKYIKIVYDYSQQFDISCFNIFSHGWKNVIFLMLTVAILFLYKYGLMFIAVGFLIIPMALQKYS